MSEKISLDSSDEVIQTMQKEKNNTTLNNALSFIILFI